MLIKKTIDGIDFTAEYKGIAFEKRVLKQCSIKGTNRLSTEKLLDIILKDVIVSPKITTEDIPNIEILEEIINFGESVIFGTFDEVESKSKLKKEVNDEWSCYRLIFCELANYTEDYVFNKMTPKQILKANIALDTILKEMKRKKKS